MLISPWTTRISQYPVQELDSSNGGISLLWRDGIEIPAIIPGKLSCWESKHGITMPHSLHHISVAENRLFLATELEIAVNINQGKTKKETTLEIRIDYRGLIISSRQCRFFLFSCSELWKQMANFTYKLYCFSTEFQSSTHLRDFLIFSFSFLKFPNHLLLQSLLTITYLYYQSYCSSVCLSLTLFPYKTKPNLQVKAKK